MAFLVWSLTVVAILGTIAAVVLGSLAFLNRGDAPKRNALIKYGAASAAATALALLLAPFVARRVSRAFGQGPVLGGDVQALQTVLTVA